MSAADEDTELRDLVAQTLHQQGILSKIKAQLRSSIFLALDEHEQGRLDQMKSPLVNKKLKIFLETKEGIETVSIVREFLQHFDLDYTLAVFEPELNHIDHSQFLSGKDLRDTFEISEGQGDDDPLLVQLLRKESSNSKVTSELPNNPLQTFRKPEKPEPPQVAPAAGPAEEIDLEDSLDRKDGLMGSFSYEESPRSPRKVPNLNNFGALGDSLSLGGAANDATKSQIFGEQEKGNEQVLGGSNVSDLYEDDFGSSAHSVNLPRSSRSKGPVEKSEISEELDDEVEEELSEPVLDEDEEAKENNQKNDVTSDHSVSRISDTEADLDYVEDVTN